MARRVVGGVGKLQTALHQSTTLQFTTATLQPRATFLQPTSVAQLCAAQFSGAQISGAQISGAQISGRPGVAWVPSRQRSTVPHKKQAKAKPGRAPPTAGPGFRHRLLGAQPGGRQVGEGQALLEEEEELVAETVDKINNSLLQEPGRLFAVVYVRGHQYKVTPGDLVMVMTDMGAELGARIRLEKVLALGGSEVTLLGRPVLPRDLARVEATVIEKTLSRTNVVQTFYRRSNHKKYRFQRSKWTLLRINSITVESMVGETRDRAGRELL